MTFKIQSFKEFMSESTNMADLHLVHSYKISPTETIKLYGYKTHHYLYHYINGKSVPTMRKSFNGMSDDEMKAFLKQHHDLEA